MKQTTQKALNGLSNMVSDIYAGAFEVSAPFVAMLTATHKLYKNNEVPSEDVDYIASKVANARNWTADSMRVRKSELKTILNQHAKGPEAIKAASKRAEKPLPFGGCLVVCRALKNGATVEQAAAAIDKAAKKPANKRSKAEAVKSVKTHIKRILEHTQMSATFRTELKKLAVEYDVMPNS